MRRRTTTIALIQAVLAVEWLVSGLTKLARGDFPSGLAADLRDVAGAGWYGHFLRSAVIPHASVLGWAIELGEVAVALLLLAGAALSLTRRRRAAAIATVLGASGGIVLAVNFALAAGASFLPQLAPDSFDEGMSLDVLATWLQLVLLGSAALSLRHRRRHRPLASPSWRSTPPRRRSGIAAR